MKSNDTLIFVYNAESGMFNKMADWAHKALSPESYQCSLCLLTHHNFGIKNKWQEFIDSLPHDVKFQYKNAETALPSHAGSYPKIYLVKAGKRSTLLSKETINKIEDLDDLIREVSRKLPK